MKRTIIILAALGLVVFAATRSNAKSGATQPGTTPGKQPLIITDHDAAYDYKYEGGRWYTHRKGETEWRDIQSRLTPEAYALAISRLTAYLNQRGITL